MPALIATVFLASVLGGLHCAGMCGAFLAFAVGVDPSADPRGPGAVAHTGQWRRRAALQAAYHLGRLATYTALGAAAGVFGRGFDLAGQAVGIQRAAVVLAGSAMVLFGVIAVLRLNGVRIPRAPAPTPLRLAAEQALRLAFERPPLGRAFIVGLATTLLPCGWLYAFVITAAGTAHPALGALTMLAFWAGTLPVLVALGSGIQAMAGGLGAVGRRVPDITATALVCVGLFNIFNPSRFDAALTGLAAPPAGDGVALADHVRSFAAENPRCHDDRRAH
ncbi:MAG: sulfite exporter TauE/SafE family protein [Phycisphaerales bacterium]|nr:sulfite exporter TauE/SafE family protein [Phycisphaerales bacterium]